MNYFQDYENFKAGKVKINLNNAKPGDRLLMRNGLSVTYKGRYDYVYSSSESVLLYIIQYKSRIWSSRSNNGSAFRFRESQYDIVYNFGQ